MRVAIVGAGLAGMATAIDLVDAGAAVEIYESRPFVGGKVGSWIDKDGNHLEMGLHVFFGCYYNLFGLMAKVELWIIFALNSIPYLYQRGGKNWGTGFSFPHWCAI